MSTNVTMLSGHIANTPRMREFAARDGGEAKVKADFLLAVRKRGAREAAPDWVRVETWGKTARNLVQYCTKGSRVAVTGRISGQYYNPDGGTRGGELRFAVVADTIEYLSSRPRQEAEPTDQDSPAVPTAPVRTKR